jgi:Uma2 family endonuclease
VIQLPLPTATDEGLTFEDLLYLDTPEGYRTELFEGKLVVSPPPFLPHAFSVTMLRNHLMRSLAEELVVVEGPGVYYTEHNYFIPDLVVVQGSAWKRYVKGFVPADVIVAVEVVSPTSSSVDNVLKRHMYAKVGIKHYWILDAKQKAVRILEAQGESYVDKRVIGSGEVWETEEPFAVAIEPSTLFLD